MFLAILIIAAAAAGQTPPPAAAPSTAPPGRQGQGRAFISPMGQPFFGRTPGEDGLVVWFAEADRNHDGAITADEMSADADRFFATLDLDHDGELDPDEVMHYEDFVVPELRVDPIFSAVDLPGGEHEEHVDDETNAGKFGLLQIPEPVASADSNLDRGVSVEEFRTAARQRFQLLDFNHTGRLTLPQLGEVRSAAANAHRKKEVNPGESNDPTSAEYGGMPPQ